MKRLYILMSAICVALFALFFLRSIGNTDINQNNQDLEIKDVVLSFDEHTDSLYLSARIWGISGNHEEIVLSNKPISKEHRSYSKSNCYIFYAKEIYYKKEASRLVIYASESGISEPQSFDSAIDVKIVGLIRYDQLADYEKNYGDYGLKKMSLH